MTTHTLPPTAIHTNVAYTVLCPMGEGYHGPAIQYCWACPQCGGHVVATSTEHATLDEIAADARCHTCRTQAQGRPGGVHFR